MPAVLLLAVLALVRARDIYLDCDQGLDAAPGTEQAPIRTLQRAQALVREQRGLDAATSLPPRAMTVRTRGTCGAARFTAADGGLSESSRVTYAALPGAAPPVFSGGLPVSASWLAPVTDAWVLEQLPSDAARAAVRELDLAAHGIPDAGTLQCKPYMGGEASILPGNLMPSGLEFFAPGNPHTGGDFAPLTLARFPNRDHAPRQWSSGSTAGYTITPDAATAARLPLWARQLKEDPGSVYVHYMGGYGAWALLWASGCYLSLLTPPPPPPPLRPTVEWDDAHHAVGNISIPPPPPTPSPNPNPNPCGNGNASCACYESGFDYAGSDLPGGPHPSPTQASCCALCASTPGCKYYSFCPNSACAGGPTMCYLKSSNAGRVPWPNRLSGPTAALPPAPTAAPTMTLAPCPSHYNQPGYDALDSRGTYYAYNLLSELDTEGEYMINRTSGKLYVWLPSNATSPFWSIAPWSSPVVDGERGTHAVASSHAMHALEGRDDPVVGWVSVNDTVLDLEGASFLSFDSAVVQFGRNQGVRANGTTGIVFTNGVIQNVGNMAVNVSGGSNLLLSSSTVRNAGNGAIYLYAGDRPTLTRSNHTVLNCSVSYSNRYMYCYTPSVALADCGNRVLDSELFGGPHQGIFMSGNYHELRNSSLHHLVQGASDSGVVYTGRDFTYQGTVIDGNSFRHINSLDGGDTSAVYLDDEVSGYTMTNNYFEDVSRALLLGGGRDNLFGGNIINGTTSNPAISFDNRGMGWSKGTCNGEMSNQFLARVPYTGPLWTAAFPSLARLLQDEPCQAKHNAIINNRYCNLARGFIDQSNDTVASWDSTMWGNVASCA